MTEMTDKVFSSEDVAKIIRDHRATEEALCKQRDRLQRQLNGLRSMVLSSYHQIGDGLMVTDPSNLTSFTKTDEHDEYNHPTRTGEAQHPGVDEGPKEPLLGLATTRHLIDEIAARAEIAAIDGQEWPSYKTAGE